ncbi:protein FAR-RED IMPAIRED RESPONSE 1-like isoform X2 [Tasmannia lanceolata]|uniref:protein FAR-RED IMPAIRED RESPONSE 1-like isoform X2 n=1 Tax=Tasmannia lanceolata TaxID=3420 RepID=UPI004062BA1C
MPDMESTDTTDNDETHIGGELNSPLRESTAIEGNANLEPYVGMKFGSEEEAYAFYNDYAKRVGFGVCKRYTSRSRKDKSLIGGEYVCVRGGYKKPCETNRARATTRIGCKAMLKAKRIASGRWAIVNFVKEHNHELDPQNSRFFRSHGWKSPRYELQRKRKKMASMLGKQSDGSGNVLSTKKDIRNNINEERGKLLAAGDPQAIHEHFMQMRHLDPSLFYEMELDEDQRLKNLFWADGKSKMAYTHFGDVVSFDTAYLTKKYHLPLATFIGVNQHGQSMLLGCALITKETIASFIWVFKTWLRAMSEQRPVVIITDQDKDMKAAIAEVFPETRHRFCLWKIRKRVHEKLGHICRTHEKFLQKFDKCVYDSMTVDDFERRWRKLIENFDLTTDEWLQILYEDRQQWVLPYLKDTFFAGMSVSQRSDSVSSFFDAYVSSKTTLKEFLLEKYDIPLQKRREKEAQADFETLQSKPPLKTPSPFEAQLASVYTKGIFKKFQVEVLGMAACHSVNVQQEGETRTYTVRDLEARKDYTVVWNGVERQISCVCCLFEFKGFLCRHAMVVLVASGIYEIPSHYILKRWTMDVKSKPALDQGCLEMDSDCPKTAKERFNDLCQRSIKFAEEGSLSKESYDVALHALQEALQKVITENKSHKKVAQETTLASNSHQQVTEGSQANGMTDTLFVLAPQPLSSIGPDKKMKSSAENSQTKGKKYACSHCKKTGHNAATCKETQLDSAASTLTNQRDTQENPQQGQLNSGAPSLTNQCGTRETLQLMGQLDVGVLVPAYPLRNHTNS